MLNMVRSMLKLKGLSKELWGEVVTTTAYILNRSPTKKLEVIIPEEAWTGKKPRVSHFRIFGSPCWKHVPDEKRKKLDDKSTEMIMVGYHPTGAYKLYDPIEKKVTYSRDVIFDGESLYDWNKTKKVQSKGMSVLDELGETSGEEQLAIA